MNAATLGLWMTLAGAFTMGCWRLLRALLAVVRALESVGTLSGAFREWTEDMRSWQGETERRLTRLETLQESAK